MKIPFKNRLASLKQQGRIYFIDIILLEMLDIYALNYARACKKIKAGVLNIFLSSL